MNSKTISLIPCLLALAMAAPAGEEAPSPSPTPPTSPAAPAGAEKAPAGAAAPAPIAPKTPAAVKLAAGLQLEQTRRHEEALERFREALALEPDRALTTEILLETGRVHFQKGLEALDGKAPEEQKDPEFREAIKVLEDVTQRFRGEEKAAAAGYLLGSSYLLSEDPEKALVAYQRVVDEYRTAKNRSDALIRMGVCQAGLDQPLKARETFERCLKEFPENKSEVPRIRKLIDEVSIVGRPAFAIGSSQWLHGLVGPEGIKAFDGQVVVLIFFATWCPNCQKELPHLRSLMKRWGSSDVIFLGVANPEDPQATMPVEGYLQKNNLAFFDVVLDRTLVSWRPYRVNGFPAAAIVDRKAMVRWRGHLAFFPGSLVEKLLKEK